MAILKRNEAATSPNTGTRTDTGVKSTRTSIETRTSIPVAAKYDI